MISGKLPNNTIWWLSTNGQKIWIENKDIEREKFKEKGYRLTGDRIYNSRREVGELTTSRLESRRRKDAWIIHVESVLDVYPELLEEIRRKEIEEKKKKRIGTSLTSSNSNSSKRRDKNVIKEIKEDVIKDIKRNVTKEEDDEDDEDDEYNSIDEDQNKYIENNNNGNDIKSSVVKKKSSEEYFNINRPYVSIIKDEVENSEKGELIMSFKDLKSKMGGDFEKIDDFRIFFGLNKILPNIGLIVESRYIKRESMAIIKRQPTEKLVEHNRLEVEKKLK